MEKSKKQQSKQIDDKSKKIKKDKKQQKDHEPKGKQQNAQTGNRPKTNPLDKQGRFQQMKEKKKTKFQLFKDRVTDKGDVQQVADYLNAEILRHIAYTRVKKSNDEKVISAIDKFESKDTPELFNQENVDQFHEGRSIAETSKRLVQELRKLKIFSEKLNNPQIMILTPDTQVVVDLYKELKNIYQADTHPIKVRVQKLFAKHITVEEHEKLLNAENKGSVVNLYIGTPNRVKKLAEKGAMKLKKSNFKHLVIDSHLNVKNQSLFDIFETRDDTFDLLILSQKQLMKANLKVSII
ncbi:UNKNOWN [Stylonychia lemnae]|uniref:Uncharacterized protein n=1 Tax=Stylonychia lemnae TaxID=5949 RepID=A0A078B544_STYLE|nr:UNKNOWN [Stylonychia lemnae]|eukprot:CDW89361.1 UNKNOWN [Stylonychia lemnae]